MDNKCPVPECNNGYIRVARIVSEREYGWTYERVQMEDIECAECKGMGTV